MGPPLLRLAVQLALPFQIQSSRQSCGKTVVFMRVSRHYVCELDVTIDHGVPVLLRNAQVIRGEGSNALTDTCTRSAYCVMLQRHPNCALSSTER